MDLASLFTATEQQYGLPSGYLARTAQLESSGNPNARNPNSSAGGLFQFIDSTANAYGLKDRYDPVAATDAAGRLARDNMAALTRGIGRQPSAAELYLAHQQGAGGALNMLRNPNAVQTGAHVALNGGQNGQTGGAFAQQWIDKFNGGGGSIASAMSDRFGSVVPAMQNMTPASFGPIGSGPAAPALGQMASEWVNNFREKQAAQKAEEQARRAALFGDPQSGGLGALYR